MVGKCEIGNGGQTVKNVFMDRLPLWALGLIPLGISGQRGNYTYNLRVVPSIGQGSWNDTHLSQIKGGWWECL